MKQETKRLSSIIIAALIIIVAVVVYFEFIVPAYTNLEAVKGQEESEKTLYANEQQIVTEGKALLATYQSEASSSQSVTLALPVGQDISGALAQVYGIAANSNLTVQNVGVSVQAVAQQNGTTDGQIADAAASGSVIKPIGTVSFQITAAGSYESLKNFLQGLETNIRIFDVTALSLEPAGTGLTKPQASNVDMFNYSVTVVTYYQAP